HETGGAAIYMGVYRMDSAIEGGSARLRLIASTQSLPEGIQAMVNDARREGGTLRDKLQRSISSLDLGEIEEFDLFKTTLRTGHGQHSSRRRPGKPNLALPDTGAGLRRASERVGRTSPSSPATAPAPEADADPDPARGRLPSVKPAAAFGANPVRAGGGASPERGTTVVLSPSERTVATPEPAAAVESGAVLEAAAGQSASGSSNPPLSLSDSVAAALESVQPSTDDTAGGVAETPPAVPAWKGATERDDDEPTREFQMDSIIAPPPSVDAVPQHEWTGTRYFPGTEEYNALDPHRQAEAASYQKLVATFLRTEFDSTKRRVARRLD